MKRKALRVRSEGSIPMYVTEAESRKQHSDSPLCNSLYLSCDQTRYSREEPTVLSTFQKRSSLGKLNFQGRKRSFPRVETFLSTVGNEEFLRWN